MQENGEESKLRWCTPKHPGVVVMLISLTQDCYESLRQIREEMREQKRQRGVPEKTTFSEIVCTFIREHKKEEGRVNLDSPLLLSSRDDTK